MSEVSKIEGLFKDHPYMTWGGVGLGIVAVVVVVVRSRQSPVTAATNPTNTPATTPAASSSSDTLSGYDMSSMAGIPYGFETTVPYTVGQQPITNTNTNNPPSSTPPSETGVVRTSQSGTKGDDSGYDKTHTGVPMRTSPSVSAGAMTVPFNASVNITGNASQGPLNTVSGSTSWYPVTYNGQTGFINASDLGNIIVGAATGVGSAFTKAFHHIDYGNPASLYGHASDELSVMQVL